MKRKLSALILIIIYSAAAAYGENIRGKVVESISLSDSSSGNAVSFLMNIEDVFAVTVDQASDFVEDFEVELKLPSDLREYSNSFALSIYKRISPEVSTGIGTYYGSKYETLFLSDAAKIYIQIPYLKKLETETSPFTTVISSPLAKADLPVMFTILPLMKGFPSSLYSSSFEISVSPVLSDSGVLNISINTADSLSDAEYTLRVDNSRLSASEKTVTLKTGTHTVSLDMEGAAPLRKTVTIRKGETLELNLEPVILKSSAMLDVPENSDVFIDGEKIEYPAGKTLELLPGEHVVLIKYGDYKISKKITVTPGKDCKISLFLDIFVEEN